MRHLLLALLFLSANLPAQAFAPRVPPTEPSPAGVALLNEAYAQVVALPPERAEVRRLGDVDGYPLLLVHVPARAPDPVRVFVAAGVHGSEPGGVITALELLSWALSSPEAARFDLTVVPVVNPWGLAHDWRKDGRDTDPNRTFRDGAWAQASTLLRAALARQRFDGAVDLHGAKFKREFFLIAAKEEGARYQEVLADLPAELRLPSTSGEYPSCAPAMEDPCRYQMLAPGAAVSVNEGTLKDYLSQLGTPRSYTLEYPGQLDPHVRNVWNFRLLLALLGSLEAAMPAGPR